MTIDLGSILAMMRFKQDREDREMYARQREEERESRGLDSMLQLAQSGVNPRKVAGSFPMVGADKLILAEELFKASQQQQKRGALEQVTPELLGTAAASGGIGGTPRTTDQDAAFAGSALALENLARSIGMSEEEKAARQASLAGARLATETGERRTLAGEARAEAADVRAVARREASTLRTQQDAAVRQIQTQAFGDEKALRSEYAGLSKNFIEQRNAMGRVRASAKTTPLDPNNAAGDVALVFNYLKVLDPGSTVREGEYDKAQSMAGLPEQARQWLSRVESGASLTPQQRRAIVARSEELFKEGSAQQRRLESQFRRIARRNGLDEDGVLLDIMDPDEASAGTQSQTDPNAAFGGYVDVP